MSEHMTSEVAFPENAPENVQEKVCKILAEADDAIKIIVPFPNDDVPTYLRDLQRFQEESREIEVMVD